MNIIDNLIESYNTIVEGLEKVFDNEDYVFVKDKEDNILCTLYNTNKERDVLDRYLDDNNLSRDDVRISVLDTLESEDIKELFVKYKITD